ncbi:rna 3' terminal phosphate cyclase, putative [Eimeria necatrix]|uniref:Rna 3' terminal phosphate cyclase, putative n=1 Tax=Eimeria necatrix TaxID=51315 RepID=U6MNM7_9EIME|nr:rna 3' terminal phosphate cyclase, putative [Eimeria necatrix]CDJ64044.1 rna 3' terminal phosphate cyclase, putative [Eimeria necatrix]
MVQDSFNAAPAPAALVYEGHNCLRERLCLSVLSGKDIWVRHIREDPSVIDAADGAAAALPGLQQHEASFIRLLCKVTEGSEVYIHPTGTSLRFRPGLLLGVRAGATHTAVGQSNAAAVAAAAPVVHNCHESRGISYYLEPLLYLAPFCKYRMSVLLRGVTDAAAADASVDFLRLQQIPLLQQLLKQWGGAVAAAAAASPPEIKVHCRGLPGSPFGVITFKGPEVARGDLQPFTLAGAVAAAPVKRVRGVAFAAGASAAFPRRAVCAARGLLNMLLPDVWVYVEDALKIGGGGVKRAAAVAAATAEGKGDTQQHQLQQLLHEQKQKLKSSKVAAMGMVLVAENIKGGCRAAGDAIFLDPVAATDAAAAPPSAADTVAAASRATGNVKLQHLLQAEAATKAAASTEETLATPEEQLGLRVARLLLLQLLLGGAVPPRGQKMALLFAALAGDHAPSKVLLSRLTPSTVGFLRLLRDFFGVAFTFEQQEQGTKEQLQQQDSDEDGEDFSNTKRDEPLDLSWAPQVLASCVGIGYKNTNVSSF